MIDNDEQVTKEFDVTLNKNHLFNFSIGSQQYLIDYYISLTTDTPTPQAPLVQGL